MIDLHVHSTRSDGTYTPARLVDYAMEKGLSAFALTDHDTVDGLDEAISHAAQLRLQSGEGIRNTAASGQLCRRDKEPDTETDAPAKAVIPEVIPGVELSTEYRGQDVHMVGLYIDYRDARFQEYLQDFVNSRDERNQKMCTLLQRAGMEISYEALQSTFPNSVITRAHYAKYMLMKGYVKSIPEAFERYVGDHCPYYIPREKVTPAQGVSLILEAGGIPILAHPILYHMSDARLDALTGELKEAGLMGIEAIYSTYHTGDERQIRQLASKYDLLISGGSDFHGANKPGLDLGTGYGKLCVPDEILVQIRLAHENLVRKKLQES